jgi:type IV pilus assembly protein PilE
MKTARHNKNQFFSSRCIKNIAGFTLVELLIVIAIIGILGGIAIPLFLGERSKAIHTEAKSNLESLRLLEEQYFAENGCYYREGSPLACTNKTITGLANIQVFLPGFRPGADESLNFIYEIVFSGTPAATEFTATATGKASTPVKDAKFSIDQDNIRSGF